MSEPAPRTVPPVVLDTALVALFALQGALLGALAKPALWLPGGLIGFSVGSSLCSTNWGAGR